MPSLVDTSPCNERYRRFIFPSPNNSSTRGNSTRGGRHCLHQRRDRCEPMARLRFRAAPAPGPSPGPCPAPARLKPAGPHLVQPLLVRRPLKNALDNALELKHGTRLLGVRENGGLVAPDHKEHVLGVVGRRERKAQSPPRGPPPPPPPAPDQRPSPRTRSPSQQLPLPLDAPARPRSAPFPADRALPPSVPCAWRPRPSGLHFKRFASESLTPKVRSPSWRLGAGHLGLAGWRRWWESGRQGGAGGGGNAEVVC